MQLGRAIKYLLEDKYLDPFYSQQINFKDYPDVVNFAILAEAYKVKYLQYQNYIETIKAKLIEKCPNLKSIKYDPYYNKLIFADKRNLSLSEKIDLKYFKIHSTLYDRAFIDKDENGELSLDDEYTTLNYKQNRKFLDEYKEIILELFSEGKTNPFLDLSQLELNTIDNNFKTIEIGCFIDSVTAFFVSDLLSSAQRDLFFEYKINDSFPEGQYRIGSSFMYVNNLFSANRQKGHSNMEALASKILLKESEVPEFFQEEVHRQKILQLNK